MEQNRQSDSDTDSERERQRTKLTNLTPLFTAMMMNIHMHMKTGTLQFKSVNSMSSITRSRNSELSEEKKLSALETVNKLGAGAGKRDIYLYIHSPLA